MKYQHHNQITPLGSKISTQYVKIKEDLGGYVVVSYVLDVVAELTIKN